MDPKSPNGFRKNHLNQTDQTFKVPENLNFFQGVYQTTHPPPRIFPPQETHHQHPMLPFLFLPKSRGFFASSKVNNWPVGESQPFGWSACDGKHMTSERNELCENSSNVGWSILTYLGSFFLVNKTKTNQRSRTHLKIYGIKQESYDLNK